MRVACVAAVLCVVALSVVVGQNSRHRNVRRKKSKCRYFWEGQEGPCDVATQTQNVSFPLKKGVNCPPFRNFTQPCRHDDDLPTPPSFKGCKYNRGGAQWSSCEGGVLTRRKVMMLVEGQSPHCPPSKTKTLPCRKDKAGKARKKAKRKKAKGKGKACKYQKGAWSDCDPLTNERQRELTLRKGDEHVCLPRKVITKKCKKACKYIKGPWLPCNEVTKEKTRQLTLKKGDPKVCDLTQIVKSCRRRDAFTAAKISQCRYKALQWGPCDVRTNSRKRMLTLKAGDPALCSPSKELTSKCRKLCKFSMGQWTACDEVTGLRTRTDRLVKGEPADCEATRLISRKCGQGKGCRYHVGDWGACDDLSKQRTRFKNLVSGDPQKCQPQVNITRPCYKPNGEENCFLGTWGDFGPCQNGVMMKHRPVMAGGVQCERKAVKTRPCS